MTFKHIGQETIHDLGFIKLVKNTILEDTTNTEFERECVDHIGASLVLPIMENGEVILIKQYRSAPDKEILEVVAGRLDHKDEDPSDCAKRELLEEIGVKAKRFEKLGTWLVSPGWTNELNHAFLAFDCDEPIMPSPDGIEEKFAQPIRMKFEDALKACESGEIIDAKTLILLYKAKDHLANN